MKAPRILLTACLGMAAGALLPGARLAHACGCFTPPDPSVPVVQAGERIVFAHDGRDVIAHIQIQYEGLATDFGWLVPLPSVPEVAIGTEELFSELLAQTQPRYRLSRAAANPEACPPSSSAGGGTLDAGAGPDAGSGEPESPVVVEDSIGPYDFAVLDASSRDAMFNWLNENRYFVPVGVEDVVDPYISEGAFFLALKLRNGSDAGDIQPVVLRYPSQLPMIPIVLTQVGAIPDMGVQVWVLGEHRAIPRNYRHTVLNEEHINWFDGAQNYASVVIGATNEAPDGQSFVTEYAGSTERMRGRLGGVTRFGDRNTLEGVSDPVAYAAAIEHFPRTSIYRNILRQYYPYPPGLAGLGVSEDVFYQNLSFYLRSDREGEAWEGYSLEGIDLVALTDELWARVVEPTVAANQLFDDNPVMTRLFTTLSPDEMTRDPVFSFNPDLPEVSNEHQANFAFDCSNPNQGVLTLPDGRQLFVADTASYEARDSSLAPFSARLEVLREEGAPEVEIDNLPALSASLPELPPIPGVTIPPTPSVGGGGSGPGNLDSEEDSSGCSSTAPALPAGLWLFGFLVWAVRRAAAKPSRGSARTL